MPSGGDRTETLTIGGDLAEIARAGAWLAGLAEAGLFAPSLLFEIHLCLEETLANIVLHGFADTAEPRIDLSLVRQASELILMVEDNGQPFDPSNAPAPTPPTSLEDAVPGGQGIALMRRFSDTMRYTRLADRNRLTFAFDAARSH